MEIYAISLRMIYCWAILPGRQGVMLATENRRLGRLALNRKRLQQPTLSASDNTRRVDKLHWLLNVRFREFVTWRLGRFKALVTACRRWTSMKTAS